METVNLDISTLEVSSVQQNAFDDDKFEVLFTMGDATIWTEIKLLYSLVHIVGQIEIQRVALAEKTISNDMVEVYKHHLEDCFIAYITKNPYVLSVDTSSMMASVFYKSMHLMINVEYDVNVVMKKPYNKHRQDYVKVTDLEPSDINVLRSSILKHMSRRGILNNVSIRLDKVVIDGLYYFKIFMIRNDVIFSKLNPDRQELFYSQHVSGDEFPMYVLGLVHDEINSLAKFIGLNQIDYYDQYINKVTLTNGERYKKIDYIITRDVSEQDVAYLKYLQLSR